MHVNNNHIEGMLVFAAPLAAWLPVPKRCLSLEEYCTSAHID